MAQAMIQEQKVLDPAKFIQTKKNVIISKSAFIKNLSAIETHLGNWIIGDGIIIRGDLAHLKVHEYSIICDKVIFHPCHTITKTECKFSHIQVGSHTVIGNESIVKCKKIGNYCQIGCNVNLGSRSIIGNNCIIIDGSVVPDDKIIPDHCVYGGAPAVFIKSVEDCHEIEQKNKMIQMFQSLLER